VLRADSQLRELFSALQDAETGQRGYLLTGDVSYLEPYLKASAAIDLRFSTVRDSLSDSPEQLQRLAQLQVICHAKFDDLKSAIALKQSGDSAAAIAQVENGPGKELMNRIRSANTEIRNVEFRRLGEIQAHSRAAYNNARLTVFAAAALGLSLMLFLALLIVRERRRKDLDAALLHAEKERFGTTLASIGDGVIVTDRHGQVEYVNPVAARLTGWQQQEPDQSIENVFHVIDEGARTAMEQPVRRALEGGQGIAFGNHTLLISKDGSETPIEDSAAPILEPDGSVAGVVLVFRDVADKRRFTRALERSEAQYRALFDEAGVGNANIDVASGRMIRVNHRLETLTGHSAAALQDKPFGTLFSPDTRILVEDALRDLLHGDGHFMVREAVLKRRDGSTREVRLTINLIKPAADATDPVMMVMFEDISEARRAIAALRENEMHLRLILENVIAFVLLLSPDGTVMQINGEARAIGGRASQHLVGRRLFDSFLFSYDPQVALRVEQLINDAAANKTSRTDLRARVAQGVYITIDASIAPVYDGNEKPVFLVASGIDISQRKAVEEELQRSDRRKDEFLAMLGHELRNPLAPIATAVALVRTTKGEDKRVLDHAIGVIQRQSEHLGSLVNDLLDVARFTSGKISLRLENLDIADPLNRAIEINENLFKARRQNFRVEISAQPMLVNGDLHRLTQVFGNLLNNASKYSEAGASITLSAVLDQQQVVVSVSDTGIGIGAAVLPHVFDLFTQSERALDRAQGGLGIGLTLVKRLIELHHGNVVAQSEGIGRGSIFTVRLPAAVTVPDKIGKRSAPADAPALSVLVVDDNFDAAETLCELLRLLGHRATAAYDGPSALSVAAQLAPDVVLLDIGLPGMSGLEVATKLRHLAETRSAYLVAVTGYGQTNDRDRSLEAGFDAHLVKPIDVDVLASQLQRRSRHHNDVR
jgi:PAS domain S-box-containing protein